MHYVVKIPRDVCPLCGLVSDVYTHGRGAAAGLCAHSIAVLDADQVGAYKSAHCIPVKDAGTVLADCEPFASNPTMPYGYRAKFGTVIPFDPAES